MNPTHPSKLRERFEALLSPNQPVDLARKIVALPSENPPGEEHAVSDLLAGLMEEWGFSVQRVPSPEGRPNLVATLKYGSGGKRLIYNGHLDVVPAGDPAAWSVPPYAGELREGRLYGRGATDTKGGVAALLFGARLIQEAGLDLGDAELVLHLVSDEESGGGHGAGHLAAQGLAKADAAVVVEPTGLELVVAQKGTLWYRVTLHGKAAHGSRPNLGVNAITHMARLIPLLEGMNRTARHPLLGEPTINVGTIKGGSKINTVPDICALELDRRCLPNEEPERIDQELGEILARFSHDCGTPVHMERIMFAEPCEVSPSEEIVQIALRNQERVLGKRGSILGSTGFTDARMYVCRAGTPAILLGPGDVSQAHTVDEYVSVDQLRQAAVLFAMITADFFGAI